MARDHARVGVSIWDDEDFRELTPSAQHLYFVLTTARNLSYCGVDDWRPVRIRPRASNWAEHEFDRSAGELAHNLYIVVDEETEEVLVRSFVRHDGLMKQPKMATAMARAYAEVASKSLRGVIVHELQRLRLDFPDLNGWHSEEAMKLLDKGAVDPSGYPTGYPSGKGKSEGFVKGCPTPYSLLPTPNSITPSSLTPVSPPPADGSATPPKRTTPKGSRLPADWKPSEELVEAMESECPGFDLRAEHLVFADYWRGAAGAKGVKADWDATWRNWMRKAYRENGGGGSIARRSPTGPTGPGGMSKADAKVQNWLDIGARLTNQQDQPKGIA